MIGGKIRGLRKNHGGAGISQEQLADSMNTTANTISRWETGSYRPSAEDLQRLADFFGVSIESFFPDDEIGTPGLQTLLRAVTGLGERDLEELAEYARFRKARSRLESAGKKPKRRK